VQRVCLVIAIGRHVFKKKFPCIAAIVCMGGELL
jgi:hypothetical protein